MHVEEREIHYTTRAHKRLSQVSGDVLVGMDKVNILYPTSRWQRSEFVAMVDS